MKWTALFIFILALSQTARASEDVVDCYTRATQFGGPHISKELALNLCQGSENSGPVLCLTEAMRFDGGNLDANSAVQLCRGAGSAAPAICYVKARRFDGANLDRISAIRLCTKSQPSCLLY